MSSSKRKNVSDQEWESIKPQIFQMYMVEKKSVEKTRVWINETLGVDLGTRRVEQKLQEWQFKRKIPKADTCAMIALKNKRKREENKETEFSYAGVPVPEKHFNEFRTMANEISRSSNAPLCKLIGYRTPSPDSEGRTAKRVCHESRNSFSPSLRPTPTPTHDRPVRLTEALKKSSRYSEAPEYPNVILARFLKCLPKDDPWSVYTLLHESVDYENVLSSRRDHVLELDSISKLLDRSGLASTRVGDNTHFYTDHMDVYYTKGPQLSFQVDEYCAGDHDLDDPFETAATLKAYGSHSVKLANLQVRLGELDPLALKAQFELAKVAGRLGQHGEAEYLFREILKVCPQADVQAFLGMLLISYSRHYEASTLFFSALAHFIITFTTTSLNGNGMLFVMIENLLFELMKTSSLVWGSIPSYLDAIAESIPRDAIDGQLELILPKLLLHGFAIAHEAEAHGFTTSAETMYRVLIDASETHLSVENHGNEKAEAHRRYACLLIKRKAWNRSAEQLVHACNAALNVKCYDHGLFARLSRDSVILCHLNPEPDKVVVLRELLMKLEARNLGEELTLMFMAGLSIDETLHSHLPFRSVMPQPIGLLNLMSSLPPPTTDARIEEDRTSSGGMSSSIGNRRGVTLSENELSDIPDSLYL